MNDYREIKINTEMQRNIERYRDIPKQGHRATKRGKDAEIERDGDKSKATFKSETRPMLETGPYPESQREKIRKKL